MLKELYIKNLAVIEKAGITFSDKFNVFTGETGAGKSILIGGINAVLGQRITKDIVRNDTDKAVISALFTDISDEVIAKLSELGFSADDRELSVTREIYADGKSVARINNRAVTAGVLREISDMLITIHGQHDNQVLLCPEKHLDIIDSFCGSSELIEDYHKSFRELQETARIINKMVSDEKQKAYRMAELSEIIKDISQLDIGENEDEQIEEEYKLMQNASVIAGAVANAEALLSGNDDITGALELLKDADSEISLEGYADLEAVSKRLKSSYIELSDISSELSTLLGKLEFDPQRYEFVKDRRDSFIKIKRKYGPSMTDVKELYDKSLVEFEMLNSSDEQLEKLEEKKKDLLALVTLKAKTLYSFREEGVKRFVSEVEEQLRFLDMPGVTLSYDHQKGKLSSNGMDKLELLISANRGEPPKPIAKIASGGELSRIMLALKCVIADKDNVQTLIFDEIDTGVSGRAAQKIGRKLCEISRYRQVLCVTHLAQLAVYCDNHLLIEKNQNLEHTVTTVKSLAEDERKYEIARIMGGENITELMLQNAQELINSAVSELN